MPDSSDKIRWSASFETGIEKVDEQHHTLIDTINKADKLLVDDYTIEHVQEVTKDLYDYVQYHFETEEQLMHTFEYDTHMREEFEKHIAQHREFSAKADAIRTKLGEGEIVEREEIINYLCEWLIHHIIHTDKKLSAFVATMEE